MKAGGEGCYCPKKMQIDKEHIPVLAEHFVRKYCEELACPVKKIPPQLAKKLKDYGEKGSVRELELAIKKAVIRAPGAGVLPEVELPPPAEPLPANMGEIALEEIVRRKLSEFFSKWGGYEISDLHQEVVRRVERPLIELALEKTGGNQVKAAEILGIHRNTLYKKIKELGISI